MRTFICGVLFILATASTSEGRTWRVNTAGTGDAPDLYAAMDSAAAYDSVLVEAGQYELTAGLAVPFGVRLIGEAGPACTLLYRNEFLAPGTVSLLGGNQVSGIHMRGNTLCVLFLHHYNTIDHCIVEALVDIKLIQGEGTLGSPTFENCLFIGGEIALPAHYVASIILSDLGSDAVGSHVALSDVLGEVDPRIDVSIYNLDFSLDPQFCGIPGSGNYFLKSTSPCLPENNPYGSPGLTGPLGAGCGAVRVEARSWGAIKALYRTP